VLDKGIVIDAWVRVSVVGIDLLTVEARVVVASIDTYLKFSDAVAVLGAVSRPAEIPTSASPVDRGRRPARGRRKAGVAARLGSASTAAAAEP